MNDWDNSYAAWVLDQSVVQYYDDQIEVILPKNCTVCKDLLQAIANEMRTSRQVGEGIPVEFQYRIVL